MNEEQYEKGMICFAMLLAFVVGFGLARVFGGHSNPLLTPETAPVVSNG